MSSVPNTGAPTAAPAPTTLARAASRGAWLGAGSGLLLALTDYGASWLWLPWWGDRLELLARLVATLTPLGALLGAAVFVLQTKGVQLTCRLAQRSKQPERWKSRLWAVPATILAAPGLAIVATLLFTGGSMRSLPALPLWIAVTGAVLVGGTYIALRLARDVTRWASHSDRRGALWGGLVLAAFFVLTKVDQHVLPKLYDYLHGALTATAFVVGAWGLGLLARSRPSFVALDARRGLAGLPLLTTLTLVLVGNVLTLDHNQNVRVALFEAHAGSARSVMQGLDPVIAGAGARRATAQAIARARAARARRHRESSDDGLPATPEAHVLLVTIDALRADHLGAYGYGRGLSPNLDAFAQTAVVFERAYAQAPHSSYSICSLMVSEYLHETVDLGLPLPEHTVPTLLSDAGYHTAGFYTLGIFHTEGERLAPYRDEAFGLDRHDHTSMNAELRTDRALEEVDRVVARGEPPSFFWVHYFDVHEPYEETRLGTSEMDRYDGEIQNVDRGFGRLLEHAQARLDRPIVVVISADHGEEFRDHGGVYHGSTLYEEQVRVPLIIGAPGLEPARVATPVELIDVAPTVLGLLDLPTPETMRGDDLRALAMGRDDADPGPAFSAVSHKRMVVRWPHKLVADLRFNLFEVYDLEHDPNERINLATSDTELLDSLKGEVYAWLDALQADANADPQQLALDRGRLGDRRSVPALSALIADEAAPTEMRLEAGRILGRLADPSSASSLLTAMQSVEGLVAAEAAIALGRQYDDRAKDPLRRLVYSEDPNIRTRAAVSLGRLRDTEAVPALLDTLYVSRERYEREEAVRWLGRLGDERAVEPLIELIPEFRVRYLTVVALGMIGDPRAFAPLAQMLEWETHSNVRDNVTRALGQLGDPRALDLVVPVAAREHELKYAAEALVRLDAIGHGAIGGTDVGPDLRARGFEDCVAGPLRHDWNYLSRTHCTATDATATLSARVPAAVADATEGVVVILRAKRSDETQELNVTLRLGEHSLAPVDLDGQWTQFRWTLPAGEFTEGDIEATLVTEGEGRIAVDHLLLLPAADPLAPPS